MFNRKPVQPTASPEKARLLTALAAHKPESPEYGTILDRLSKFDELQRNNTPKPVSNDTKATIAANIAGLLIVVNHERANVIATKAMQMLIKPR